MLKQTKGKPPGVKSNLRKTFFTICSRREGKSFPNHSCQDFNKYFHLQIFYLAGKQGKYFVLKSW